MCLGLFLTTQIAKAQCSPTLLPDPSCSGLAVDNYDNVVISEVSGDSGQSDGCNDGLLEIVGPPGTNIGCMVVTNTEWAVLIPPGTLIPIDGVYMIGCSEDTGANCGVGINGTSNGLIAGPSAEGGGTEGDFNAGLLAEIDLDVCNAANASFYDPAATGFTIDNTGNADGDQVMMFLPDGTPWDGIYWGTASTTSGGANTVGGASGSSDAVVVQIAGQTYTLGDNDQDGTVNNDASSFFFSDGTSGRGDRSLVTGATMVPILPTDAACPCNTPVSPGTFTVPALDDPFWFDMNSTSSNFKGCNSSYGRGGPTAGSDGNPSHMDGLITSVATDANGQPIDNGGGATGGTTGDTFTPGGYTPSSCGDPTGEWAYTDHPTPGQPNNDPTHVFYASATTLCSTTDPVTLTVEIYNYQNVSDGSIDGLSGADNIQAGSFVEVNGVQTPYDNYTVVGETTTMDITISTWNVGNNIVTLVWDDFSNCCGTSGNPATQSNPNECYETQTFSILAVDPLMATQATIDCDAGDSPAGAINVGSFVTGGENLTYELFDISGGAPGVSIQGPQSSGGFLLNTSATMGDYQVVVTDGSGCSAPVTLTILDNCELPPVCPENYAVDIDGGAGPVNACPGDVVQLCFNGDQLPSGGTVTWQYTDDGGGSYNDIQSIPIPEPPSSPATLCINEVQVDAVTESGGSFGEYIELYGVANTDYSGWVVSDGDWTITLPAGTMSDANGIITISNGNTVATGEVQSPTVNAATCGCGTSTPDLNLTNSGEFLALFDPTGAFVSGIIWEENVDGNSNAPSGQSYGSLPAPGPSSITIPVVPDVDMPPSPWVWIGSDGGQGGSIRQTTDCGGTWEADANDSPGTPNTAAGNGGAPGGGGGSGGFDSTPADMLFCSNFTIPGDACPVGDFDFRAVVDPFDTANCPVGAPDEANGISPTVEANVSCPDAILTSTAFDVCDDAGSTVSVDVPVAITGGTGPYTLTYNDGTGNVVLAGFNAGDNITIDGPTDGEIKISLVSIVDEGGGLCDGSVNNDEVCVNIRPIEDITITGSAQPGSCNPCDGTVTFDLSVGTSSNSFDIDFTIDGTLYSLGGVSLPYTINNACPGTYDIVAAIDDSGCDMTVTSNAQVLNPPSGAPIVVTAQPAAVCNDGSENIDLTTDVTYNPAYAAADFAFYTVDPNSLPTSALGNNPPLIASNAVNGVTANQTVYALYTDPVTGCESTAQVNIVVNAALCAACPSIGSITDPADPCVGDGFDITANGLALMDDADNGEVDFGIDFVYFAGTTTPPTDAYTGSTGSLGVVPFASLTGVDPAQAAALTGVGGALAADDYVVCAILSPASAQAGCAPQQCSVITINPNPTVTIADPTICASDSPVDLTALEPAGQTGGAWVDGASVAVPDATNVAVANGDMFTYTFTDANGCDGSETITYTVNANPTVTIANPSICPAAATGYDLTGLEPAGQTGGAWVDGASVAVPDATNVNISNGDMFTYTFTDANNCDGSATITFTVAGAITISIPDPSICTSDATGFDLTSLEPAGQTGGAWVDGASVAVPDATNVNIANGDMFTYTYTDGGGCSGDVTITFTVNANPTVTIANPTICASDSPVDLTALEPAGQTGGAWVDGASAAVADATNVAVSDGDMFTYTFTDANNCDGSATITYTVNANPTVTIANPTICASDSPVDLTALEPAGQTGGAWVDGASTAVADATNVAVSNGDMFTYTFTDANNCDGSATITYTVNANPTVTIANPTICASDSPVDLTALEPAGQTGGAWVDGASAAVADATNVAVSNGDMFTYTFTDANNCDGSATITYTVNANPTVTIANPTICASDSPVDLTALEPAGQTGGAWVDGASAAVADATNVAVSNGDMFTYTFTDANNCDGSATITYTVNANPAVFVSDTIICTSDNPIDLTTLEQAGQTGGSWVDGASVAVPDATSVTAADGDQFTYTFTDANGCSGSSTMTVTVNANPTVTIADPTICASDSPVDLTALEPAGQTGGSWVDGASVAVADATNVAVSDGDMFTYTFVGANGCPDSATITYTVNANPTVTIANPSICPAAATGYDLTGLEPTGQTGGAWVDGASAAVPDATNVNISDGDMFTYTFTDANNCDGSATITFTVASAITVSISDPTICADDSPVDLTALEPAGQTGGAWVDGASAAVPDATNVAVANGDQFTYTYTDGGGCSGDVTITYTVNALPVLVDPADPPAVCNGGDYDLTDMETTIANGNTGAFVWYPEDGGNPGNPDLGSPLGSTTVTPPTNGSANYYAVFTDSNNCEAMVEIAVSASTTPCASLGNYVWYDVDMDGTQNEDITTAGINGITVNLYDDMGNLIGTTVTMNDPSGNPGFYEFTDLIPGDYVVEFVLPVGDTFTGPQSGGPINGSTSTNNSDNDSNIDSETGTPATGVTGTSGVITLVNGEDNPTIDAGIIPPSVTPILEVCDCDGANGNLLAVSQPGTFNPNYTQVYILVNSSGMVLLVNTDGTGTFSSIPTGTYTIYALNFDPTDPNVANVTNNIEVGDILLDNLAIGQSNDPCYMLSAGVAASVNQCIPSLGAVNNIDLCSDDTSFDLSTITVTENNGIAGTGQWYTGTSSAGTAVSGVQTGLSTGDQFTYVYTGSDINACQDSVTISVTVNPIPVFGTTVTQPTCTTPSNLEVNVTSTGSFSYSIDNGGGTGSLSTGINNISGLGAGSYNITVTNTTTNCSSSDSFVINAVPGAPSINGLVTQPTCNFPTGTIMVNGANAGDEIYYGFNFPADTIGNFTAVGGDLVGSFDPGTYTLQLVDGVTGCLTDTTFVLDIPTGCPNPTDTLACTCIGDDTFTAVAAPGTFVTIGHSQEYLLVDPSTGLVVDFNTSGMFDANVLGLADGAYEIYALNYDDTDVPTFGIGTAIADLDGTTISGCYDLSAPIAVYVNDAACACPVDCTGFMNPTVSNIDICDDGTSSTVITPVDNNGGGAAGTAFNATWDFETEVPTGVSSDAAVTLADLVRGAGAAGVSYPGGDGSTDAFSSNNWDSLDLAGAIAGDDYYEICVNGSNLNLSNLSFGQNASSTGPSNYDIQVSLDGGAYSSISNGAVTDPWSTVNVALSVSASSSICFRVYAWGASSANGTWRIDDVMIDGTYGGAISNTVFNFYTADPNGGAPIASTGLSYDPGTTPGTSPQTIWVVATDGVCTSDTLSVTVTVEANPNAGGDGADFVCNNATDGNTVSDLTALLSGADAGGTWYDNAWTPLGITTIDFDGTAAFTYTYWYVVPAAGLQCQLDTAMFNVTVANCDACTGFEGNNPLDDITVCDGDDITLAPTGGGVAGFATMAITEIHYDDNGADDNEGVEISGPAGSLDCFEIWLHNGSSAPAPSYNTVSLGGFNVPDAGTGFGSVFIPIAGIQNGSADGIVLVDTCSATVVEYLSYEGTQTAADGPAAGMTSTDVGVSESNSNPEGLSLQLTDGGWVGPVTSSYGVINAGLTVSAPLAPSGYNFYDVYPSSLLLGDATSYMPTLSVGTDTIYITAVNTANACASTAVDTVIITVNANPVVDLGDDVTVCAGTDATFDGPSGYDTYEWLDGVGVVATTEDYTTSTAGTYTLTVTLNGCSASDDVQLTVNPLPPVPDLEDAIICSADEVTYSGPDGDYSYEWSDGVNVVSTDQSYTITETGNFTLTVTDNVTGCSASDGFLTFVSPSPTVDAGPDVSTCAGGSVTLTATGDADSYMWNTGETTASITVSPAATTTYTVTATTGTCTASDDVEVSVADNLNVNAGDDVTICLGEEVTLTASGALNYNWNTGESTAQIVVSPTEDTMYIVTGDDGAGCDGTDTVWVFVNPLPTVDLGDDQAICLGDAVTLTANGTGDVMWNTGETTVEIVVSPTTDATYSVTLTDANGCQAIDDVNVTVNPLPTANAGDDVTICAGEAVELTATGGGSYMWSNGETTASITVSPTAETTYTVTVTSDDNCVDSDEVTVFVNQPVSAGEDASIILCNNAGDGNAIIDLDNLLSGADAGGSFVGVGDAPALGTGNEFDATDLAPNQTFIYQYIVTGIDPCADDVAELTIGVEDCAAFPDIVIVKDDGDDQNDYQTIFEGETAVFTITIFNLGTEPLDNIVIVDPLTSSCDFVYAEDLPLMPGGVYSYQCEMNNVNADFLNTAHVVATGTITGIEVTDSDSTFVNVEPIPCPIIEVVGDPTAVYNYCPGDEISLEVVIDNADEEDIVWSTGEEGLTTITLSDLEDATTCDGYTQTVTASIPAGHSSCTDPIEVSFTINVLAAPEVGVMVNESADGCSVSLQACPDADVLYTLNGQTFSGSTYTAAPEPNTTEISVVSFFVENGCGVSQAYTGNINCQGEIINICENPMSVDYEVICNEDLGTYDLFLTLSGGSGEYVISGDLNEATNDTFINVGTFPDASSFSFTIADPTGACPTINLFGTPASCVKDECPTITYQESIECDATTYDVVFIMFGGNAPYSVSGDFIMDGLPSSFVVGPFADDTSYNLVITDADGCEVEVIGSSIDCSTTEIELLSFRGEVEATANLLEWITATEVENDYFTLERSFDGINFEAITIVQGAGNSVQPLGYSYLDVNAKIGENYYRLLTTDFNGKTEIASNVVLLMRDAVATINVHPIPTTDYLVVDYTSSIEANIQLTIYDVTGRLIDSINETVVEGVNTYNLDVAAYAAGSYIITVQNGEHVTTTKFIKD